MATKQQTAPEDKPLVFDIELSDTTIGGMCKRRAAEASTHWNKEYDLDKVREANKKIYNSDYVKKALRDERYEEIFSDNKIFVAVRTVLAFLTSNLVEPDIIPANDDSLSLQFADDFKKILQEVGDDTTAKGKIKLAIQDLLKGKRVGILKWVYDPLAEELCLEHVEPSACIIGKRSKLYEEFDFFREKQKRSVGDLIRQFPDKEDEIKKYCNIEKGVPSQLEEEVDITENRIFIEEKDMPKLAIVFMLGDNLVLGKMSDPNWIEGKDRNVVKKHMMPYICINFLNDGSGYIDETSFLEQAEFNQKQYDKRGNTIAENAAFAGSGVPVFGAGAVKEETAAQLKFAPTQRVILDTDDVNKSFTTWTAGNLPNYVFEDKQDMKESVLDQFGSNQIQAGGQSDAKTLGQDVLMRNQAEGRQQDPIDCVEYAMRRYYNIEAQMIYRYFDDVQYYNFIGDDGQFEHLAISQQRIAKNLGIKIKINTGTGLPTDRSQKIAQAMKLVEYKRIGTLRLYKELGIENPEEAYKEYLTEMLSPQKDVEDMDKDTYDREADEDLQLVIGGKVPKEREDITPEYIVHLNEYLMKQQYEMLPEAAQKRVTIFVAEVIAQAERKILKMQTQAPLAPDMPPVDPATGQPLPPDATMPPGNGGAPDPNAIPPAAPPATLPVQ